MVFSRTKLGTFEGFFVWMLIEILDLLILNPKKKHATIFVRPFQFIIYLNVTKTNVFRSLWYHHHMLTIIHHPSSYVSAFFESPGDCEVELPFFWHLKEPWKCTNTREIPCSLDLNGHQGVRLQWKKWSEMGFWPYTLPETNSSHLKMDGWNTIVSFWVSAHFQVIC